MQHYRLPTRLLDWTESPMIACYFAVTGSEKDEDADKEDGALFALSPYRLNSHQIGIDDLLTNEKAQEYVKKAFDKNTRFDSDKVVALLSQEIDIRMTAQLSAFTIHGPDLALDDIYGTDTYMIRYKIPSTSKRTLRRQLKYLGVRPSNVFPDLEHLARELKDLNFRYPGGLLKEPGFKELDDLKSSS